MKRITKLIAIVVVGFDNVLYRTFGIVSALRKHYWAKRGRSLQVMLDEEHKKRDMVNAYLGTNYTTKRAIAEYYDVRFEDGF